MLTTAHFEHAAPIMAELDLEALLSAQAQLEAGKTGVLQDLLITLGKNGKTRTFRRLAAIVGASVEQLLEAELDEAKMTALELEAAKLPFLATVQRVFGFFSELVPSAGTTLVSSGIPQSSASVGGPEGSRSADS